MREDTMFTSHQLDKKLTEAPIGVGFFYSQSSPNHLFTSFFKCSFFVCVQMIIASLPFEPN